MERSEWKVRRVLLLTAFEYPHIGGLSTHMAVLGTALELQGNVVDYGSVLNYPRWFYYLVVKIPSFLLNKAARGWGLVWSHQARKLLIKGLLFVRRAGSRYDVINAQDIFAVNAVGDYDKHDRLPVVLTVHGYFRYETMSVGSLCENTGPERYFIKEEEHALDRADRIVAVEKGRQRYLLGLGVPDWKVSVITNFIDPAAFGGGRGKDKLLADWNLEDGRYVILCPCRMARVKGVDVALNAMSKVAERRPESLMLFAGDGELKGELERESLRQGLQNNVRFLGNVAHAKMVELYSLADLVIIPSISDAKAEEGVSLAALEAMASGKPLITTPVGGFKDLIRHGENGYLVPERDPEGLAEGILALAKDSKCTRALGKRERDYVLENHDACSAAIHFEQLYAEAVAAHT
ncbi:MAG: glycosyltransferase family 4 protein [Chloroflexi bacterium]|nr:glycosyltransferase family 4 protein [Chloroflexota bacterium]